MDILEVSLGFDPTTSNELFFTFNNAYSRGLWCMIKRDHNGDQNLNGMVRKIANDLAIKAPMTLDEFLEVAKPLYLYGYGTFGYGTKEFKINEFIDYWRKVYTYAYLAPEKLVLVLDSNLTMKKTITYKFTDEMRKSYRELAIAENVD